MATQNETTNAQLDFEIGEADMDALRALVATDYGESAAFPVYSGKERSAVTCASS